MAEAANPYLGIRITFEDGTSLEHGFFENNCFYVAAKSTPARTRTRRQALRDLSAESSADEVIEALHDVVFVPRVVESTADMVYHVWPVIVDGLADALASTKLRSIDIVMGAFESGIRRFADLGHHMSYENLDLAYGDFIEQMWHLRWEADGSEPTYDEVGRVKTVCD